MEQLPTRRLGRTGIDVSYPALGCGALNAAGSDADAVKIVHRAIEHGINYLDTAPLYGVGESERLTGLALSGGFREKVTLATKCGDPCAGPAPPLPAAALLTLAPAGCRTTSKARSRTRGRAC